MQPDLARLLALVGRELGSRDVSVLELDGAANPAADGSARAEAPAVELRCSLPDGRALVVRYDTPPADREAMQRRLEMLASTFDAVPPSARPVPPTRPAAGRLLREELQKVCDRAGAINAMVIDANSPILWGAARSRGVVPEEWTAFEAGESGPESTNGTERANGNDGARSDDGATDKDGASSTNENTGGSDRRPDDAALVAATSRKVLEAVRKVVDLAALRKSKRARHVEREGDAPFVTHSFAGIYLLTLVFPAPFDELRAERAIAESLPRIERLVMALPPLEPPPRDGAGVIAIRRARRR